MNHTTESGAVPLLNRLRRFPDVEAANLQAWDATDSLLLDAADGFLPEDGNVTVIGDRYGALTLSLARTRSAARPLGAPGSAEAATPGLVRVHQDLVTGEKALRNNAASLGIDGFVQLPLGPSLLSGARLVVMQLPRTLAELEEAADAVARYAEPDVVLLAGGRIKHMSLGMNNVLARCFEDVEPQLARQKSRVLVARTPKVPSGPLPYPIVDENAELGITVCAHGAVFSGTKLDIGTRFLLTFLPKMASASHAVDLGCGTGILAAMYARSHPDAQVTATDRSAAAVASATCTAQANGLSGRIKILQDDAMESLPEASAGLILLNPPFHLGASVHAGAGIKLFEAAARVLEPGGELWTVFNSHLPYLPALERLVGRTMVQGRNTKFTVARSISRGRN
ncbi:methyltransferase [Arthrobacter sp.]|uniref:class I SAM-dependent methyltransferase n=1 Tax=Arthrobacter sp. TaxID=1667 RepID=UPI0028126CDF|nr:methyltransferase [Arthrobacter sp.]